MGILKKTTSYCSTQQKRLVIPDWEDHPSWITGIDALESFHHWVSNVVLPIAFQWIEENHDEVYGSIPDDLYDDVGVVIAAAYELIKKKEAYQKGLRTHLQIQEDKEQRKLDTTKLNPIWTKITKGVRKSTEEIFKAEKPYLDDTI